MPEHLIAAYRIKFHKFSLLFFFAELINLANKRLVYLSMKNHIVRRIILFDVAKSMYVCAGRKEYCAAISRIGFSLHEAKSKTVAGADFFSKADAIDETRDNSTPSLAVRINQAGTRD